MSDMNVVITRGNSIVGCPSSAQEDKRLQYSNLNPEQFIIYCKECLKEKLSKYIKSTTWNIEISREFNRFTEGIPNVLFDFSTEESTRLLLKHLDSNMNYLFNANIDREEVYGLLTDLKSKDPRLKNN